MSTLKVRPASRRILSTLRRLRLLATAAASLPLRHKGSLVYSLDTMGDFPSYGVRALIDTDPRAFRLAGLVYSRTYLGRFVLNGRARHVGAPASLLRRWLHLPYGTELSTYEFVYTPMTRRKRASMVHKEIRRMEALYSE